MSVLLKFAILTLAITSTLASTAASAEEKKVQIDDVPPVVKTAIEKAVGGGRLVDIGEVTTDAQKTYEIEMHVEGKEIDVVFDATGHELSRSDEGAVDEKEGEDETGDKFQHTFGIEDREFSTTGRNKYFILEPGFQQVLEGKDDDRDARLQVTVLNDTREIGGIQTRVVEERETVDGKLVEVSRNFFAICKNTGSVFYFGEEVDIYRDGKVIDHEGAWLHGQDNAQAGIMMPGECLIGAAYYQEYAPKKAMDRARIQEVGATIKTPAGEFSNCLKVWEENPLDGDSETKTFAPGIGLVQDEGLLLVKQGFASSATSEVTKGNGLAGVYNLVSVNRHELPATVLHGDVELIVRSGIFTINADGTCSSKILFGPPSGASITRDVDATYTRDGSQLNMQWVGAGKTTGIIKGETFTMNNEGMVFAYTKQTAIVKQKVLDRFIGNWRSVSAPRESAETTATVGLTYRRILGGKFVEEEGVGVDGSTAKLIYTYDPQQQCYRLWSFRSSMPPSEATGQWDAETQTFTWAYAVNEGQEFVTVATHRFVDDDTFEWNAEGKDASGEVIWRVEGNATRISESKE